ncbi:hypothetical protein L9F63_020573, partial [Diploptera punctata]
MSNLSSIEYRKDILHTTTLPVRPRSLYTAHSYHGQADENNFQRFNDYSKYFDAPPSEQWAGCLIPPQTGTGFSNNAAATIWRQSRGTTKPLQAPYYSTEESCENWREHDQEQGAGVAIATPHGTMSLRLHDCVRVDMTIDRAVRIINFNNKIVLCLSGSGSETALLHPNGRIYQYGSRVEILAHDAHGNNKFQLWKRGVSFTSQQCALVYLVDAAGTRTTTDNFSDMSQDFSLSVFYNDSRHGPSHIQEAISTLQAGQYWVTDEGIENWIVNNVRISQTPDGLVRAMDTLNKYF